MRCRYKERMAEMEMEKRVETLKLTRPIFVNGEEVSEVAYDFDALTAADKLSVTPEMLQFGFSMGSVEEYDANYHFFLFAKAAERASGGKVTAADLLRLSARDGAAAGRLAKAFFFL